MTTEREVDIWMLEIQTKNDELERQWIMEKLGKRAQRMQDAGQETALNPDSETPADTNGY